MNASVTPAIIIAPVGPGGRAEQGLVLGMLRGFDVPAGFDRTACKPAISTRTADSVALQGDGLAPGQRFVLRRQR